MIELTRRGALVAGVAAALSGASSAAAGSAYLWREGAPLNQYDSDRCTAWAAAAAALCGMPRMTIAESQEVARRIWLRAEQLDVYPGRVDRGATTMQGSAAALVDLGVATSIRWLSDVDDVLEALRRGPVVLGGPWVVGMMTPRNDRISYGSDTMRTSHAAALTGLDPARGIRVRNSWGRSWGRDGSAWLSVADLRKLWAWQPPPSFPGPFLATYSEAYRPVGLAVRAALDE